MNSNSYNWTYLLIKAGAKIVFFLNDKQVKNKYFNIIIHSIEMHAGNDGKPKATYTYHID